MAKANWTCVSRYAAPNGWVVSTTLPHSATHCLTQKGPPVGQLPARSRMFYTASPSLVNSRITAWIRIPGGGTNPSQYFVSFLHRVSNIDAVVPGSEWRITNGYQINIRCGNAGITNPTAAQSVLMSVWKNSAYPALNNFSLLTAYAPFGPFATIVNADTAWQKWRCSVRTEFGNQVIRVEHWNGTTWDVWYQYEDNGSHQVTAGGYCGLELRTDVATPGGDSKVFIDDITVESLA